MGEWWLLGSTLLLYLLYGLYVLYREFSSGLDMQLYILVKDQEENIEGIIRYIIWAIKKQSYPGQLIINCESSSDSTMEIIGRLSDNLSFIVREIKSEWHIFANYGVRRNSACHMIDIRGKKGLPKEITTVSKLIKHLIEGLTSRT
jgi:hypothetical protein